MVHRRRLDHDRLIKLVQFDAVDEAETGIASVEIGQPGVVVRAGSAGCSTKENLIDERLRGARVDAGDDHGGGRPAPTSAMPNPSPSFAIAHCVDAMTRSATFVVATEQLVGCQRDANHANVLAASRPPRIGIPRIS